MGQRGISPSIRFRRGGSLNPDRIIRHQVYRNLLITEILS